MEHAIKEAQTNAVEETFSLLDYIAQIEHGTDLESCLLNGRSEDSQRKLREFKKKMGIEWWNAHAAHFTPPVINLQVVYNLMEKVIYTHYAITIRISMIGSAEKNLTKDLNTG